MMFSRVLLLAGTFAVATFASVLVNTSFESGSLGPWFQNVDGVRPATCGMPTCEFWNVTNTLARTGTYSATDIGNLEMRQDFSPVSTAAITQLGFWVYNPNPFDTLVGWELFYASDPNPTIYLNFFAAFVPTGTWLYIDILPDLQAGESLVGLGINGSDRFPTTPAPRLYVDDVAFEVAVPEPAMSWLLGLGFLMLVGLRAGRQ